MYENFLGEKFMGIIKGVNKQGLLLLERQDGTVESYNFKEISYL
jgi:biotin-(acetyl-CoA carboxylase) ligase